MSERCPFCGHDPYHYVDIGVGMEAVAVTCCELGIELFDHRNTGDVTISREEFSEIATKLMDLRREAEDRFDGLAQIEAVCIDNEPASCRQDLALKFVCDVAVKTMTGERYPQERETPHG